MALKQEIQVITRKEWQLGKKCQHSFCIIKLRKALLQTTSQGFQLYISKTILDFPRFVTLDIEVLSYISIYQTLEKSLN